MKDLLETCKEWVEVIIAILIWAFTLLLALIVTIAPYCVLIACMALCAKWILESLL